MAHVTMKQMLDSGVHFGHQTQRWNPKMKPYVYTVRGGIHIIDLQKSVGRAQKAAEFIKKVAAQGGRMIFVGTKKQAIDPIQEAAKKCGQFYVTKRWLGGTLTNFVTIKNSIDRMKKIEQMREKGQLELFAKKERGQIEKEYERLTEYLDGIREMKDAPSVMFVVDLNKEHIAVAEAKRLGMPVVGIADTNCDPETIEFPIPGNDDAIRSIQLFSNMAAEAYLAGAKEFSHKLRSETDKQSDVKAEEKQTTSKRKAKVEDVAAAAGAGPAVVKVTKTRKLVAAGLADQVEIEQELDETGSSIDVSDESEESTN